MSNPILADQHAVITGGGSGIGLACARAMLADGARVSLLGRSEEKLVNARQALAEEFTGQAINIAAADVADEDALAAALQRIETFAPLTVAVANAGTGYAGPFLETDSSEWQRVMQTNLSGTYYTFKHAGRAIAANGGGAMCAISSIAGLRTHKLMSAYCTSKAGIDMLVRNVADELGQLQVRVNSVCPGLVETELSAGLHETPAMREDYLQCMPVRRVGTAADIAAAVRFLCGPEASWITGAVLPVDGGHHLRRGPNLEVML